MQKNDANKLIYINNEFKDISRFKSQDIVNVNNILQPVIEERRSIKIGRKHIRPIEQRKRENKDQRNLKKQQDDVVGNNIDIEG